VFVVVKDWHNYIARFKSYTGRICFWKQVFAMATTRVIFWHRAKPILIFLAHLAKDDVSFSHHLVSVHCLCFFQILWHQYLTSFLQEKKSKYFSMQSKFPPLFTILRFEDPGTMIVMIIHNLFINLVQKICDFHLCQLDNSYQYVQKRFWQTSLNSILEYFFLFN
jgi:hypothetical protein